MSASLSPASHLPPVTAVVCVAMASEAAPFLAAAEQIRVCWDGPVNRMLHLRVGEVELALVVTGIGLVNAASSLSRALSVVQPRCVISGGTIGGLHPAIAVGDLVLGSEHSYHGVDATAFGFSPGQVPRMPASYPAAPELLQAFAGITTAGQPHTGPVISGDTFISAALYPVVRQNSPAALGVDMESTALAQVAWLYQQPFLTARVVSDLCGPQAGSDFAARLPEAAREAATAVLTGLQKIVSVER